MIQTSHILVVDDDHDIRTLLGEHLQKNGFRVTTVADGRAMWRTLERANIDLIVLDLMLPGDDGLKLCRDLRAISETPILMLTALREEIDRVLGLEVGADDYMAKPFSPRELLGRIRAILRRTRPMQRDTRRSGIAGWRFGQWRLDLATRSLMHADGPSIALNGAEFRLLSTLLAHHTRVLTRGQLVELMRGRELDPYDRSIDVRISRLRQTLRDDARSPSIIKTVYGEGYVIGVPVEHD